MKELNLSTDGVVTKKLHVSDDEIVFESSQDVTPILDHNQARRNQDWNKKADMWPVASIPRMVMAEWLKEFERTRGYSYYQAETTERWMFIKAKLNDRDWSALRTREHKL